MSNGGVACPDVEELSALLAGSAPDETLVAHLDICEECQRSLDLLTDSPELSSYLGHSRRRQDSRRLLGPPIRVGDLGSLDDLAIEKEVGRGSTGVVFRGRDEKLSRRVAVKALLYRGGEATTARFLRESKAMARLEHDNVVSVYSTGCTEDGTAYIVMPLIEGTTLKEKLRQKTPGERESAELIKQIALGLQAVHDAGLIHRDIKPENVLIERNDGRARLTDFGLARIAEDATLTQANVVAGTPGYMSPEQIVNPSSMDVQGDIYSLGITLYECLTGTVPFTGQPLHVLEQHRFALPVRPSRLNPRVSRDLENVCLMAIAKDPARRYPTAKDFADDLQRFLEGKSVHARETTRFEQLLMWCERNRTVASLLGLLFFSLLIGTVTTSLMWRRSAASAAKAQAYAQDLEQNRNRLRQSVSRFQQRIFSEEAMHWQMTESFRAEMFEDVISYLDEFAALASSNGSDAKSPGSIASDYLMIANAALEVGQVDAAQIAADRSLMQIKHNSNPSSDSSESLLLHFEAARVACLSRFDNQPYYYLLPRELATLNTLKSAQGSEKDEPIKMVRECEIVLKQAALLGYREFEWKMAQATTEYLRFRAQSSPNENDIQSLYDLFDRLSESNAATQADRVVQQRLAQEIGSWLALQLPIERALEVVEQTIAIAESFREKVRENSVLLVESDFRQARNFAQHAVLLKSNGDLEGAIQSGRLSQKSFLLGNRQRPQNRFWMSQAMLLDLQLSDWLEESGDVKAAISSLDTAIRACLGISKLDRADRNLRRTIIKLFVKLADLSFKSEEFSEATKEYFIAAQDSRLIIDDQADRNWVLACRPWLVSRVLDSLEKSPNPDFKAQFIGLEGSFIAGLQKFDGVDPSGIQSVLDTSNKPKRPTELTNLTSDILLEDY